MSCLSDRYINLFNLYTNSAFHRGAKCEKTINFGAIKQSERTSDRKFNRFYAGLI